MFFASVMGVSRRAVLPVGLACAATLAVAPASSAADIAYFGRETAFTATTSSGKVIQHPTGLSLLGATVTKTYRIYNGSAARHDVGAAGSAVLRCAIDTGLTGTCTAALTVGKSRLRVRRFTLGLFAKTAIVPIAGGDGRFAHARGTVTATNLNTAATKTEFVISLRSSPKP